MVIMISKNSTNGSEQLNSYYRICDLDYVCKDSDKLKTAAC